jgi:hypothetical protein
MFERAKTVHALDRAATVILQRYLVDAVHFVSLHLTVHPFGFDYIFGGCVLRSCYWILCRYVREFPNLQGHL